MRYCEHTDITHRTNCHRLNIVLDTLSHFIRDSAMAAGSEYNVDVLLMSHTAVKNALRSSIISTQYGLHLLVLYTDHCVYFTSVWRY